MKPSILKSLSYFALWLLISGILTLIFMSG